MSFDEAKHKRGGKGTEQGGKFVAQGTSGTPTQTEGSNASEGQRAQGEAKRNSKIEASIARNIVAVPPAAHEEYRAVMYAAHDEKDARKASKVASQQARQAIMAFSSEQDPARKAQLVKVAEQATQAATEASEQYVAVVEEFVKKRDAYYKKATSAQKSTPEAQPNA
jgi:hypothetical protein